MSKKWVFKFLNDVGVSNLLRNRKKNKLTVLSLHRVSPETDFFWNPLKPASFDLLLQYLRKYYHIITFAEIAEIQTPGASGKPFLVLSFDDGYHDFYEYALPLLVKYNIPCNHNIVNACAENNHVIWTQRMNTIFTHCRNNGIPLVFEAPHERLAFEDFNSDWLLFYLHMYKWMLRQPIGIRIPMIEQKEREYSVQASVKMMNWQQVRECAANGVEIGSHTYTHDVLSTITDPSWLHHEIVGSAKELQKHINCDIQVLALPNSEANADIHDYAREAGIRYVLYVENNLDSWNHIKGPGVINVDRINIVEEPISSMILRAESLHAKLRQYV